MWSTEPFVGAPPVDELLRIAEECDPIQFELDKQSPDWEKAQWIKEITLDLLFAKYIRVVTIPAFQNRVIGVHGAETFVVAMEFWEKEDDVQLEKLRRNEKRLRALGVQKAIAVREAGWLKEEDFEWQMRNAFQDDEFVAVISGELSDFNYRWKDIYEKRCLENGW